jgi:hypothetical protein
MARINLDLKLMHYYLRWFNYADSVLPGDTPFMLLAGYGGPGWSMSPVSTAGATAAIGKGSVWVYLPQ